jgi:hypothetical protein
MYVSKKKQKLQSSQDDTDAFLNKNVLVFKNSINSLLNYS